ncbi:MAG: hypothetical protein R2748_13315 [Bryobacterales bacterium]
MIGRDDVQTAVGGEPLAPWPPVRVAEAEIRVVDADLVMRAISSM